MAEYQHGSMDITAQQKAFAGFLKTAAYVVVASIAALIFLALTNA